MSEYWVSQAKKYCEFCKCWIADNKPSRDFHEKGKKHQENVKKKIDEVRRKSVKDAKKEEEMNDSIREMNENALRAFKKDLLKNPALRAQYGVSLKPKEPKPEEPVYGPLPRPEGSANQDEPIDTEGAEKEEREGDDDDKDDDIEDDEDDDDDDDDNDVGTWQMAVSEQGYPYYWNDITSEVTWVAPRAYLRQQGIPRKDYHKYTSGEVSEIPESKSKSDKQGKDVRKKKEKKEKSMKSVSKEPSPEIEEPKSKKAKIEEPEECIMPETPSDILLPADIPLPEDIPLPPEPKSEAEKEKDETKEDKVDEGEDEEEEERAPAQKRPKSHASYGTWEQVQPEVEPTEIDLGLPVVEKTETVIIPANEPKIKFREKTVSTLGSGPVFFKKPKKKMTAAQFLKKREDS